MAASRRRRALRLSGVALCLACLSAQLAPGCAAQELNEVQQGSSKDLEHQPVIAVPALPQETTSSVPLDDAERKARLEEADRKYAYALELLDTLRARSIPVVPPPPPTSLFSSASYTPLLDLIEAANRGPISPVIRIFRRFFSSSSRSPLDAAPEQAEGWSVHRILRKLKGDDGDLWGSPAPSAQDASKRILNGLAGGGPLGAKQVKEGVKDVMRSLTEAAELGKDEAYGALADLQLWGRHSVQRDVVQARDNYKRLADRTGNVEAQYALGFLYASAFGGAFGDDVKQGEGDQGTALLYYTFAALGGSAPAEMTVGYRHWVGIATKQSCGDALPFYKNAADKAMKHFLSGPPGGRHLPPSKTRLSDLEGGVYGPGASVSGAVGHGSRSSSGAITNPTTEQEWEDVLEYYQFHADRGDAGFMFRLGRIYYTGYGPPATHLELGGRDYPRALKWFMRIGRSVWPRDVVDPTKDVKLKVDDHLAMVAGLAAGYLGRMHLRGEGVQQDFRKAALWFRRGIGQGDQQSHNGMGIILRDGLGVPVDVSTAVQHFQTAAAENFAEAQVNLGRFYLSMGDANVAAQYFEIAIRNGDQFQAFYYLAELNAHAVARPDLCPVAVAFYKIVSERGDWTHEVWWEAERAWHRGDKDTALLGYWMMAERGYEVAQNNIAWIFDREKQRLRIPLLDKNTSSIPTDRLALTFWTRSAAQDNVDALVKMGDYYLKGVGVAAGRPQPEKAAACYQSAASTHVSALAMHNLGWMHENGIGVNKDYHLAKRYYDLAFETSGDAYFPVFLSLLKLHIRSLYDALTGGGLKSISFFDPHGGATGLGGPTNAEAAAEEHQRQLEEGAQRLKRDLKQSWWLRRFFGGGEDAEGQDVAGGAPVLDHRPRQGVDGGQQAQQQAQQPVDGQRGALAEAQRALQGDDDPVRWAREARRREEEAAELEAEGFGPGDYFDAEPPGGQGALGVTGLDEGTETLLLVGLCIFVAWLVYVRQERQRAADRQQQQRDGRDAVRAAAAAANAGPGEG